MDGEKGLRCGWSPSWALKGTIFFYYIDFKTRWASKQMSTICLRVIVVDDCLHTLFFFAHLLAINTCSCETCVELESSHEGLQQLVSERLHFGVFFLQTATIAILAPNGPKWWLYTIVWVLGMGSRCVGHVSSPCKTFFVSILQHLICSLSFGTTHYTIQFHLLNK